MMLWMWVQAMSSEQQAPSLRTQAIDSRSAGRRGRCAPESSALRPQGRGLASRRVVAASQAAAPSALCSAHSFGPRRWHKVLRI
jgi:hypothetical protein